MAKAVLVVAEEIVTFEVIILQSRYGCDSDGTVVGRVSAATFCGHRLYVSKLA